MAQLALTFKTEISRLARKESRKLIEPVRRSAIAAKHEIAVLKRRLAQLERALVVHSKRAAKDVASTATADVARRFRAQGVKTHRQRLGLSAEDFGKLLGVTSQAVYGWEQGKSRPRPDKLAKLIELRTIGRRQATARLAEF